MKLQSTSKAEASEGVQKERERETARRDSFELKTRLIRFFFFFMRLDAGQISFLIQPLYSKSIPKLKNPAQPDGLFRI
jgi:hypothetical protein